MSSGVCAISSVNRDSWKDNILSLLPFVVLAYVVIGLSVLAYVIAFCGSQCQGDVWCVCVSFSLSFLLSHFFPLTHMDTHTSAPQAGWFCVVVVERHPATFPTEDMSNLTFWFYMKSLQQSN